MKLIDKNYRLFGIINPIDLIVALVLIAVVAVAANVLFDVSVAPTPTASQGTVRLEVVGQIVNDGPDLYLEEGDPVSRLGGAGTMGTVLEYDFEPVVREDVDLDGNLKLNESTRFSELTLVIEGPGTVTADGVSIGSEQVRQNQSMDLLLPRFQIGVRVVDFETVE